MGKLIDADKLKRKAQKAATEAWKMKVNASVEVVLNQFIDWIDVQPPVDAAPVRHGRWIPCNSKYGHDEKVYLCNQCNHNVGFKKMNFCPNCGARMDGDDD